ncbi:MAG: MBL fold metallo-hydrolase, partial [Halobacteriota archaeon]|nr:MBL fold metallo-hydrolase [Halobacteriota archaeon]
PGQGIHLLYYPIYQKGEMMKIKPLAFDSFGVRSMATFVATDDLKILIDPGVALGPSRYKLPPHMIEINRELDLWGEVKKHAEEADLLIITHYHYDHYNPEDPQIYKDKVVYLKDPKKSINKSQKERASNFLKKLSGIPRSIDISDDNEYKHGSTKIKFSSPVFHGTNAKLGYVTEVSISCGDEKMLFTSDVEGASVDDQVSFILDERPNVLILDGPMTYMLGYRYSNSSLEQSIENIIEVIDGTDVEYIIMDHHFLRDLKYTERIKKVYEVARDRGVKVITAAEYAGRKVEMLEARRKELYEEDP